jgi:hypothetical protein
MFHTLSSKFRQMVILLALFAVVLPAQTESSFSGGDGTEASPYQISTVADLQQLATDINSGIPYTDKFFKLTKNLDLSSVCGKDVNGKEVSWAPIGTHGVETGYTPFEGHFDGNNHTISNLYINSENDYLGLFGLLRNGSISNLGVINSSVSGTGSYTRYIGGVCGYNDRGSISNSYNTGSVSSSDSYVGGVCGYNDGGTISNSYNNGSVSGKVSAGGVCGNNDSGTINNSYNSGNISGIGRNVGGVFIGGVCGQNTGTIKNSYNNGSVIGIDEIGGVCGRNDKGTIETCYNSGSVTGDGSYIGGVCGDNCGGTINNNYNSGSVSGAGNVGSVCGRNYEEGTVSNSYYDKQMSPIGGIEGNDDTENNVVGKLTSEMIGTSIFSDANWVTADNMYPRLKGIDTTAVAIVSATPIFLTNEETSFETSLAVRRHFTVGTGNNITWSSQQNKVSINGSAVTLIENGTDTLVCTLGSVTKLIALNVTDMLTKIEYIMINTASSSKYTLFPSHVTAGFYIDLGTEKGFVVIYNLDGKQMQMENVSGRQYIDISGYAQGLYIVKANGKSWKITKQ